MFKILSSTDLAMNFWQSNSLKQQHSGEAVNMAAPSSMTVNPLKRNKF